MSQKPPSIPSNLHNKITTLPDFFLSVSVLSLFLLVSSPKPNNNLLHQFLPPISFQLNPRHFLTISATSCKNQKPRHHFATPQCLSDWLKPRLPSDSFASWGVQPGTKNVHNLWLELSESEGETALADSTPPVRTVEVVVVRIIGRDGRVLVESHQELSDGTVRNRGRPLSEKMKPGESVEAVVARAVKEELGSIITGDSLDNSGVVRIVPNSYTKRVEERFLVSYPGLPACYVLHSFAASLDGLPDWRGS